MQFRDLKTQYEKLKKDIDEAVVGVMDSGSYILGNPVGELEAELADYVGTKHCISCGSGTDALFLALLTWEIKAGDAVFVPDFTFFASAGAVARVGATPVLVDVDKDTFNIDPEKLELKIQAVIGEGKLNPRAIVAVDLFGLPADFNRINDIAEKYDLKVLEDAAQGFGGRIENRRAGSFGTMGATSFFPAKPLGCFGDGGAVFTNDDELADLANSYRSHGKGKNKYDNVRKGFNTRLDTIQAAVLQVKFKAFKEYELEDVNKVADKYTEALKEIVKVPVVPKGFYSSWAQYTIQLSNEKQRNKIKAALQENGIPSMIYYQKPIHRQKALDGVGINEADYLVTNSIHHKVLSLPMHPYMTNRDIQQVVDTIEANI